MFGRKQQGQVQTPSFWIHIVKMSRAWENRIFAYAKTKTQISFAVTAKLISAFVFAIWIVHFLFFLIPKFQASSHLLWLYSLVCVRPGWKPEDRFSDVTAQLKLSRSDGGKSLWQYCKNPKFSDARKLCCKLPKIHTKRPNHWIFCPKDANEIVNKWRPWSDCSSRSSLIWVCTVSPDLSVQKLRVIPVIVVISKNMDENLTFITIWTQA